jgi:hypothetical protein
VAACPAAWAAWAAWAWACEPRSLTSLPPSTMPRESRPGHRRVRAARRPHGGQTAPVTASPDGRNRLAFWIHQLVEYLVGTFLLMQGVQSSEPLVPALAGVVVLAVATTAHAPLSAFKLVPRPLHRLLDIVLLAGFAVLAVTGLGGLGTPVRILLGAAAAAMLGLLVRTDYRTPVKRARGTPPTGSPSAAGAAVAARAAAVPRADEPVAPAAEPEGRPDDAAPRPRDRPPSGGEAVGRAAGRLVGKGVNAYRRRKTPPAR